MDIRSFFGGHRVQAPSTSAAKAPAAKAPARAAAKAPATKATKAATTATKRSVSSEDFKLLQSAKRKKTAKAARATAAEASWRCTPELLAMQQDQSIHSALSSMTTNQLKIVCEENGVKRSGAKYKILANLKEHARQAEFRAESTGGASGGGGGAAGAPAGAGAAAGAAASVVVSAAASVALEFAKPGMTFAGARGKFRKACKASRKIAAAGDRLDTVRVEEKRRRERNCSVGSYMASGVCVRLRGAVCCYV